MKIIYKPHILNYGILFFIYYETLLYGGDNNMGFLALYVVIAIVLVLFVLLISALYPKIGKFVWRIGKDAHDIINKEYDVEKKEEKEE